MGDGESDRELDDDEPGDGLDGELDDEPGDGPDELGEDASSISPVRGCLPSSCALNDSASVSLALSIRTCLAAHDSLAIRFCLVGMRFHISGQMLPGLVVVCMRVKRVPT